MMMISVQGVPATRLMPGGCTWQGDTSCKASSQAVLFYNYFLIVHVKIFARNVVYWEEMRENERNRWIGEGGNVSLSPFPPSLPISSLYLHFPSLSISSFSLHFLSISSFSPHFLAAWLPGCSTLWQPVSQLLNSSGPSTCPLFV